MAQHAAGTTSLAKSATAARTALKTEAHEEITVNPVESNDQSSWTKAKDPDRRRIQQKWTCRQTFDQRTSITAATRPVIDNVSQRDADAEAACVPYRVLRHDFSCTAGADQSW